jgi:nucleotide-binding universal stress UspA family protein
MKIRHTLAPTDFSEYANQAVTAAFELARSVGAKLTVLPVVEPPSYGSAGWSARSPGSAPSMRL